MSRPSLPPVRSASGRTLDLEAGPLSDVTVLHPLHVHAGDDSEDESDRDTSASDSDDAPTSKNTLANGFDDGDSERSPMLQPMSDDGEDTERSSVWTERSRPRIGGRMGDDATPDWLSAWEAEDELEERADELASGRRMVGGGSGHSRQPSKSEAGDEGVVHVAWEVASAWCVAQSAKARCAAGASAAALRVLCRSR